MIYKLLNSILFVGLTITTFSQSENSVSFSEEVFSIVEEMPIYKGCEKSNINSRNSCTIQKIQAFLTDSVLSINSNLQDELVYDFYFKFVVDKKGYIKNVEQSESESRLDNLMIKKIKEMPKFIPGKQRGFYVNVQYVIPLHVSIK